MSNTIAALHTKFNEIRDVRSQLQILRKRLVENREGETGLTVVLALEKTMTEIEEALIQTKMKSTEGDLSYPERLNEQIDFFSHTIETDLGTTEQMWDVYSVFAQETEVQVRRWNQIKNTDLPALNGMVRDLPAVTVTRGAAE